MTELLPEKAIRTAWDSAQGISPGLRTRQQQALDAFLLAGFPTTRHESWKYTDVHLLAETYQNWLTNTPNYDTKTAATGLVIPGAIHIRLIDGRLDQILSGAEHLPEGVFLGSITELAVQQPDKLEQLFGQLARTDDSGFVALNTAFVTDGVALLVPDGVAIEHPVYVHHISQTRETNVQTRLLVELGARARATVVEHFSSHQSVIVNAVAELTCKADSNLTYCKLQAEHQDAWHTAVQYADIARDALIQTTHIDVGANLARNEFKLRLTGQGARAEANGLFMADGNRHVESRIDVDHLAPNTTSRERFRGILGGQARGVFNGRIHVHQSAQKTAAELTNRNLLLNTGAEINTKPELEIYADDVKCAHGSTTGQLDRNALFYLLTRGVDLQKARNILITAFAAELLTGIPIPAIATVAREALEALRSAGNAGDAS